MHKKNASIQSIADELGISVTTVSRALNGLGKKYRISEKTIAAVKEKARKQNYTPNRLAKSLRLKKTSTIGLIMPDISNPWFAKIALKIEKASRNRGYNILLCNSNDSEVIEKNSLKHLQNWMVDGIIMVPIGIKHEHIVHTQQSGTPVVLIDRYFEGVNLPYISTNDFEGAYKAVKHLIENGHQKIVCVQGVAQTSSNKQRVSGYKKAIQDANLPIEDICIIGKDFSFATGYQQGFHIITHLLPKGITAVFSSGNQITLGLLKAFTENNIQVPKDVSIISFDEQNYSELLYTPMSTISHLEEEELGELALGLLFNEQNRDELPNNKKVLLSTELIQRSSVKNLSEDDGIPFCEIKS